MRTFSIDSCAGRRPCLVIREVALPRAVCESRRGSLNPSSSALVTYPSKRTNQKYSSEGLGEPLGGYIPPSRRCLDGPAGRGALAGLAGFGPEQDVKLRRGGSGHNTHISIYSPSFTLPYIYIFLVLGTT